MNITGPSRIRNESTISTNPPGPLKILMTNQHLNLLGGSETFTYTLALALRRAGHHVTAFTAEAGGMAERIRVAGIEVLDDPDAVRGREFDIIHCHHNLMALTARALLPRTPMLFLSHGIMPGLEEPPSIDLGIACFFGVSEEVRENLRSNYGIAAAVQHNGVDCERFIPGNPLPQSPRRILVLSNHFPQDRLSLLQEAGKILGAEVRGVGLQTGSLWEVEKEINAADIVVSLGRGVLESMACGRAVLIYDRHGGDGLLTPDNYAEIRLHNFSGRRFCHQYTLEQLVAELRRYTPAMGAWNRHIAVEHHSIDAQVIDYEAYYRDAIRIGVPSYDTIPAREILFTHRLWKERLALWSQAVQLDAENQRLRNELAGLTPKLQAMMQRLEAEKRQLAEERKRLGLDPSRP